LATVTDFVLADGRNLDLRVAGPDDGPALVYIHGTPSSAAFPSDIGGAALARGMRLVSWSRAGYATSSRRVGRTVADSVSDAAEVLDHLGIESAYAVGWSGGGPHVLACAALLPQRFRAIASLAGVAPYVESQGSLDWLAGMGQDNIDEFGASIEGETALRRYLEPQGAGLRTVQADGIVDAMASLLPEADRRHLTGALGDELALSFREAVALSVDGWLDDDLAFVREWGFDLGSLDLPVTVWQGSDDLMVPFAHGEWLAAAIPGATARLITGDGHLSIGIGRAAEIVDDLLARG
jgi:pimeloyl-ACP methyl ester carboxylesterase